MTLLDRRQFGSALLGGAASLSQAQQPPVGRATFGFSLYGMRTLPLDEALEACAKIGYDAVEFAVMPGYPAEPSRLDANQRRRLHDTLRRLNLRVAAIMENLPLEVEDRVARTYPDRLKAAAELGQALAADGRFVIETILGGGVNNWEKVKKLYAQRLAEWAKVGEQTKTPIAIKPHRQNAMNLPEHVVWLLREVGSPWIVSAYDYSHFEQRNLTLPDTLKAMFPGTRFIHVKDVRVENGRVQFVLPGDGQTDYVAYFKLLSELNYQGCVCIEVSGMVSNQKGYDPVAAARRCYANLAPAFAKAGLRRG